ncbi:MAG: response regulator [Candidatus Omnitrophica bacterium]|nr:response regulator [Candidatus Omnitrophota bacterium]
MDDPTIHYVLVVEDDPQVCEITQKMIERRWPVKVLTAAKGKEAIELAKKHQPILVLLDIHLEGPIDGFTVFEEIRKFDDLVKVLIMTGTPEDMYKRIDVMKHHTLEGVIGKPINYDEMISRLNSILDETGIYMRTLLDPDTKRYVKGSPEARAIIHDLRDRLSPIYTRCERISKDIEEGLVDEAFKSNLENEMVHICKFIMKEIDSTVVIVEDIRRF